MKKKIKEPIITIVQHPLDLVEFTILSVVVFIGAFCGGLFGLGVYGLIRLFI